MMAINLSCHDHRPSEIFFMAGSDIKETITHSIPIHSMKKKIENQ